MVVVENQITENGNVLYIQTSVPAIAVSALIGFTDATTGETSTVYYRKQFQISRDRATWSEWKNLTIENIQSFDVTQYDQIYVRYKYEHIGEGTLTFLGNTMTGEYEQPSHPYYFDKSIFSKYFGHQDIRVLRWYLNVVEKLYTVELNKYIEFTESQDSSNTTDATAFWQSITKYFAFYVVLARTYGSFYTNVSILNSYLQQRGLFTADYSLISELNHLMRNFSSEIMKRGTPAVYKKKDPNNSDVPYSELQRLLEIADRDELIVNQYLPQHCGWWIDEASPLYRGLEGHINANLFPRENYPEIGGLVDLVDNFDQLIVTNTEDDFQVGIEADVDEISPNNVIINFSETGLLEYDGLDPLKLIPVSIRNTYVIEFDVRVSSPDTLMSFGAKCFSLEGSPQGNTLLDFRNGNSSEWFFENQSLERFSKFPNKWFTIKGIIYGYRKPFFAEDKLGIGIGHNLTFDITEEINLHLYPQILTTGNLSIRNIAVRPLMSQYERGFVHMNHFISIDYTDLSQPGYSTLGDNLGNQIADENATLLAI